MHICIYIYIYIQIYMYIYMYGVRIRKRERESERAGERDSLGREADLAGDALNLGPEVANDHEVHEHLQRRLESIMVKMVVKWHLMNTSYDRVPPALSVGPNRPVQILDSNRRSPESGDL